jgi:hypothetical protein
MNDSTAKYMKMLKQHIDRIVVGAVYVLLALLLWFWYSEQTGETDIAAEPQKADFTDPVAANANARILSQARQTPDIIQFPEIEQVRKYNMFDYKTVKQRQEIEQLANQKFQQARDALARGQKEEAIRLLRDCLANFPTHQGAKELYSQLTGEADASTTATASAASADPTRQTQ